MGAVTLRVETTRWRAHLHRVADTSPGLVPVAKGNGYGFGLGRLAVEAEQLGAGTLAVGVAAEVAAVHDQFGGDIVIMTPFRPGDPLALQLAADPRIITTVSRLDDLTLLAGAAGSPRVVVEVLTTMCRHGIAVDDLPAVPDLLPGLTFEGWTIHLPIAGNQAPEAAALVRASQAAAPGPSWLSHLPADRARQLGVDVRLRVGTKLWLGDPASLRTTATVLDVHRVRRGEHAGYRLRRVGHDGWLVVLAGGTANGIALSAPTAAAGPRQRALAVISGGLEASGRSLSPYTIAGKKRWFLEPPHMQVSLVLLPDPVTPPAVGEEIEVQVRNTTALFDRIVDA